jgi:peroxiredoxin
MAAHTTRRIRSPRSGESALMKTNVLTLAALCLGHAASAQQPLSRDTRPIHAYLSLPAVGTAVPQFSFHTVTGAVVSDQSLRGSPTVLAFWSTGCSASRRLLKDIETLHTEYAARGVRIVILAEDSLPDLLRYRDSVGVSVEMAAAPDLMSIFDGSATAPERASVRVQWALPLFMVVDRQGRVVMRDGGPAFRQIRDVLDAELRAKH